MDQEDKIVQVVQVDLSNNWTTHVYVMKDYFRIISNA